MAGLTRIELDVLKPNEPSIIELLSKLNDAKGVKTVDITVREVDQRVETVRITILGDELHFNEIKKIIDDVGASIHSIDRVSSGEAPA